MARLLANVAVDDTWYGPDYGNADRVPSAVAARIDPGLFAEESSTSAAGPGEGDVPQASLPPAGVADEPAETPRRLQDLTVDQLKAVAVDAGIDLGSARRKADIVAVLAPRLDLEA